MAVADAAGLEDPFAGILHRSSVAQTLRQARASLARPSRPLTATSRSLFQKADDPCLGGGSSSFGFSPCSRPSTSYSLDQLMFVKDSFSGTSLSGVSTRSSSARLHDGEAACAPIPELEEPVYELADVCDGDGLALQLSAPTAASRSRSRGSDAKFSDLPLLDDEEYDEGGAAELALKMDVPLEESDGDDDETSTKAGTAPLAKPPRPAAERGGPSRPRRKRGAGQKDTPDSAACVRIAGVRQVIADLAAFEKAKPKDTARSSGQQLRAADLAPWIEKAKVLVSDLRGPRQHAESEEELPELLRAVLSLMDKQSDSLCLLRLAGVALELLRFDVVLQSIGVNGVSAANLNIAKALFKLSKESRLDAHFREEKLMELLLELLGPQSQLEHCSTNELRIFTIGILKNITHNEDNQAFLMAQDILPRLAALMRGDCNSQESSKEVQLLIQITALLRNLASSEDGYRQFLQHALLSEFTSMSMRHGACEELLVNVSRILGKLSVHDEICQALSEDPRHLKALLQALQTHGGAPALVSRLAFVLGNLTAKSDDFRMMLMIEQGGMDLFPGLLERYWQEDRLFAQAGAAVAAAGGGPPGFSRESGAAQGHMQRHQEVESVLVKLVRLLANVTLSAPVGVALSSMPGVVDSLLDILGSKQIAMSEELVLSALAAVTNLLFYDSPANQLTTTDNEQLLVRLLRPMLLESYNVEALVEAARALGNLTRHKGARELIIELRIDEVLCILLAHEDRDLVFYCCGALVNVAADPAEGKRLSDVCDLRAKLAVLLGDTPEEDEQLFLVTVKVLANLCLDEQAMAAWPCTEVTALRQGLLCWTGACDESSSDLLSLPARLLNLLAPFEAAALGDKVGTDAYEDSVMASFDTGLIAAH